MECRHSRQWSSSIEPVVARGDIDLQRHFQIKRRGHDAADQLGQSRQLRSWRLENQLVVDLEQHAGFEPLLTQFFVEENHGPFDQVRS